MTAQPTTPRPRDILFGVQMDTTPKPDIFARIAYDGRRQHIQALEAAAMKRGAEALGQYGPADAVALLQSYAKAIARLEDMPEPNPAP